MPFEAQSNQKDSQGNEEAKRDTLEGLHNEKVAEVG